MPASTSSAHRSEQHANAKNAAAGSAISRGSARTSRPRSVRQPSAVAAAASTK